jgi:hypothetical protein
MANWMIRVGELVVALINLMSETQLGYDILQMDRDDDSGAEGGWPGGDS